MNKEKKLAILQSNYIPWKGYFDMIAAVDEFILYDDMQFTRRDWRNRNKIKTPQGLQWLTVPVKVKGKYLESIRNTELDGYEWVSAHCKALYQNYRRAAYFDLFFDQLESILIQKNFNTVSVLNRTLIEWVCTQLEIETKITNSWDYSLIEGKTERLVDICLQAGATEYISGPAAKNYINESFFKDKGIKVSWFSYSGYPEYPQLWGQFEHGVTILDILFNCGKDAKLYLKNID